MRVAAVVVAAGKGTRFGSRDAKALERLSGEPLLVHSARAMAESGVVDRIAIVAPADRIEEFEGILRAVPLGRASDSPEKTAEPTKGVADGPGRAAETIGGDAGPIEIDVVGGGRTRQESVARGLDRVFEAYGPDASSDCVLIHDAARPLVPGAVIRRVVDALAAGHPAVVPALPVADTIKRVERIADGGRARLGASLGGSGAGAAENESEKAGSGGAASGGEADAGLERVVETHDRTLLRAMQTPQGFHLDAILRAHRDFAEKGEEEASAAPDDAALVEAAGLPVVLVRGSERSMKITRPIDLAIAQLLADDPSLGA
ncbi:hypothetical protein A4H34_03535 [Peptidiphaga gingivicola]|uniref:2-C-methyl-D-erythritol 4-phosphate cytidylyltransferase n=1 Tax=Peptidiphaga gingivicola TaxID=2741497 RepID=A0A179B5D2_9ACTO|nr:IspD/TarI family cytidylyltransferase [Peptidiphaga gingivicola]OAP86254.1 hypothetical protein A4H34_03535 [Peptidiphaga gingivicola]